MFELMTAAGKPPLPQGNIKKFDAGAAGIVALASSGNLYSIGDQFVSGQPGVTVTKWTFLVGGVENFWMSYRSMIIKMKDGRWLFLGSNSMFPSSLGSSLLTLTDVSEYMQYPEGLTIESVSIGMRAIAVVFTDGQYAMCGSNTSGSLGQGNTTEVRTLTMRTDFTNVRKIDFDPGASATSYLHTRDGKLYVAGLSDYGQAGVISTAVTTWRLQSIFMVDFFPATAGVFFITETDRVFAVYVQGRQFDGSLGTGALAATPYPNPTPVWQNITDKTKGYPVVYPGLYSARVTHPVTGVLYYTGTASGSLQGTGDSTQPIRYSFTSLPAATLQGEYHYLRASYNGAYLLINGVLYGTGMDSGGANGSGLLPGLGGSRSFSFVELDTTPVI